MNSIHVMTCSAVTFDGRSCTPAIATSWAEELDQLHGKVGQKSRIVLMTPAIVDFSKWLEDEDQLSIEEQVDVMTRVACRRDGPRVHGFVGFDPRDRLSMTIIGAKPEIRIRWRSCAAPSRFIKSASATRLRRREDSSVLSSTRRWDFKR